MPISVAATIASTVFPTSDAASVVGRIAVYVTNIGGVKVAAIISEPEEAE